MASDAPVVVIVAPPGFGKTTVLLQYQAAVDRPFAWLSLDDTDNDPAAFWSGLVASIARVVPGFASSVLPALSSVAGVALRAVVARILNEMDGLEQPIVLALDDYHRITDRVCHETVALLLERQPSTVRLIIATRSDPPLPLARSRANGQLTELRAADLGFTPDEAGQVLNETWGLGLPEESVTVLQERTEGWPAGLYLACLSLRGARDATAFVADFGGGTRMVIDYLMEVVLDQQSEDLSEFLMQTSVLEGLSGSLCDAVTGRTDSSRVLMQFERDNLFLLALDERRQWFRYHHLFGQALSEELDRRHPGQRRELHRRAAAWFAEHGDFYLAVQHTIAGGDLDTAATLVATFWIAALNQGRLATVHTWLATLPQAVVDSDARLQLVTAWAAGLQGDAEVGLRAVQAARQLDYQGELPDGSGTLEQGAALVRGAFPWWDVGEMVTAGRAADANEAARKSPWQAVAAIDLGWALILAGEPDQARVPLTKGVALAASSGQFVSGADACALLAETAVAVGDLDQAEELIEKAMGAATEHGFSDLPLVGHYYVVAGTIRVGRGDDAEADRLISAGLAQMQDSWEPLHVAQAMLALAPVRQRLGSPGEARELINQARTLIDAYDDPGVLREQLKHTTRAVLAADRRVSGGSSLTKRELAVLRLL
ncbi:MAG: hypothetical protein ABWZ98_16100, partial [Nakamurella sp.]